VQGRDTYPTDKSVQVWQKVTGPDACNTICDPGQDAGKTTVTYTNFPAGTTWKFDVAVTMSATGAGAGGASVRMLGPGGWFGGTGLPGSPYSINTNLTYTVTIDSSGAGALVTYDPSIAAGSIGDTGEATVSIAVSFTPIN
jgi:hypothetical protein